MTSRFARLTEQELSAAGEVLGRAFFDDPLVVFVEPDDELRGRWLPWAMTQQTAHYRESYGEVYRTPGRLEGVALWRFIGQPNAEGKSETPSWLDELPARLGKPAYERWIAATTPPTDLHERDMPTPHCYLEVIGVDPPCQGRGLGDGLIAPILARADRDRLPCYLLTHKAGNVSFYQKYGYDVCVEDDIPNGGLRYWTMRREPRSGDEA